MKIPFFMNLRGKFLIMKAAHSTGKLKFDGLEFDFVAEDLADLGEIGRGNFGTVNKMTFNKTGCPDKVMAVKRIRSTVDEKEQKQLLMDLEVVMKSSDCPFIVTFYGAIFQEGQSHAVLSIYLVRHGKWQTLAK